MDTGEFDEDEHGKVVIDKERAECTKKNCQVVRGNTV